MLQVQLFGFLSAVTFWPSIAEGIARGSRSAINSLPLDTKSNISIAVGRELEHLYHQSLRLHYFLFNDFPSRNVSFKMYPSYLLQINQTMESLLHNITEMVSTFNEIEIGSKMPENPSMDTIQINNISQYSPRNLSLVSSHHDVDYNQSVMEIEVLVKEVLDSRNKAQSLAAEALTEFNLFKNQTIQRAAEAKEHVRLLFDKNLNHNTFQSYKHYQERVRRIVHENHANIQNIDLLVSKTWENAGYEIMDNRITSLDAREIIKSITLETFRFRDDTKKDYLLAKEGDMYEAKTRKHIGVRNFSVVDDILDSAILVNDRLADSRIILYFNVATLPKIASDIEKVELQVAEWIRFFNSSKSPLHTLARLQQQINSSENNESVTELAFRVAAMQSEVLINKIVHSVGTVKYKLKELVSRQKLEIKNDLLFQDLYHALNMQNKKSGLKIRRIRESYEVEAVLSSIMELVKSTEALINNGYTTSSEASKIIDQFEIETMDETLRIFADAEKERNHESLTLERVKIIGEEARRSILAIIDTLFSHVVKSFMFFTSSPDGYKQLMRSIMAIVALVLLVSLSKEAVELVFDILIKSFSMPRLVREWGLGRRTFDGRRSFLKTVILKEHDKRCLERMCKVIHTGRKRFAPLRNVLIIGQPGTGKSLIAKALAEDSGLPYAIMSGADIAPLRHHGPSELQKVVKWIKSRKYGGILVIDDAESALGKRMRACDSESKLISINDNAVSSTARDVLNVFLSLTGDTEGKLMLILTSSNPAALDEAVLDRCDDIINCSVPSETERKELIYMELQRRFNSNDCRENPLKQFIRRTSMFRRKAINYSRHFDIQAAISHLSSEEMTKGFSGRELASVIRAVESAVHESEELILTPETWDKVVTASCNSINAKQKLIKLAH